jgi:ABC-type sulfate transport system permease component
MKNITKAMVVIIVALMVLIPFASTYPDGLEKVAESIGVTEPEPMWKGLMPEYRFPAIENSYFATLISGLIGVLLVCSIAWISGILAHKRRDPEGS